jgi:hypothetical protein
MPQDRSEPDGSNLWTTGKKTPVDGNAVLGSDAVQASGHLPTSLHGVTAQNVVILIAVKSFKSNN